MSIQKIDNNTNIAIRSDLIIEARFSLTIRQNNILDMLFCEIEDDDRYQYTLDVQKYKHLYKGDTSNIYRDFKKAVKSFEGKGFYIFNDKHEEIFFVWFSKIHYLTKEGRIQVNIDPDLKKMLYEVKKKIYYDIKYTVNFRSIYSPKYYMYLKSFEDTGWRIDSIEGLLRKLECPQSYNNIACLKRSVLEPVKEEINSMTDILFQYEIIKNGRKATHIKNKIISKTHNKSLIHSEEIKQINENNLLDKIRNIFNNELTEIEYYSIQEASIKGINKNNIKNMTYEEYIINNKNTVDNWLKDKKDKNFIGAMVKALQNNWSNGSETINKSKQNDGFGNYPQRDIHNYYDGLSMEEIANKLAGLKE